MDGFFSLSPSFKWTTPTWFMHDIEKTASITARHSCSSNTIHDYHGRERVGGVGTIIHILAHITGKLVFCIFPVTPDTVSLVCCFFSLSESNSDWNERSRYTTEAIHCNIEITCACSIGNKVLVKGNTNVTLFVCFFSLMARLRHCILKPMPASRHRDHATEKELLLDTDPAKAALWILFFFWKSFVRRRNATPTWDQCLRATLVYLGWVSGLRKVGGRKGGR